MKNLKLFVLISALLFSVPIIMASETDTGPGPTIGTVAETMESGGYSYLRLEEQGIWIATASMPVAAGDKVQYSGGSEMRGFFSKSLNRTFESIYFIQNVSLVGKNIDGMSDAAMEGHAGMNMPTPKPVAVKSPAPGDITPLKEGKTGKNWITLQDGTGTEPNNKLLATSTELASPGDMVIARGIVRTDIDIGSGYKYKVLLEEVTFSPGFE